MKKIAATILFYLIVLTCTIVVLKLGAAVSCDDIRKETGMQTKYSLVSGCYLQDPNGRWWPM